MAVQPTYIRILEAIVFNNLNREKIRLAQYVNQAGFTVGKGIKDNLEKLWKVIDKAREE